MANGFVEGIDKIMDYFKNSSAGDVEAMIVALQSGSRAAVFDLIAQEQGVSESVPATSSRKLYALNLFLNG